MERFYQTEWQGIEFKEITTISETKLPGSAFYDAFYQELFKRYGNFSELDKSWQQKKKELADWILLQIKDNAKILSVGCGLGYMEFCIHRQHHTKVDLHVSDFASHALKWLQLELPSKNIHYIENKDRHDETYDLIYLSAVDYAVSTRSMIRLLSEQRTRLRPNGSCIMISASYLENNGKLILQAITGVRNSIKTILTAIGIYKRANCQFWGWKRTRHEYQRMVLDAGYKEFEDGFIETDNQKTYFIKGRL